MVRGFFALKSVHLKGNLNILSLKLFFLVTIFFFMICIFAKFVVANY